MESEDVFMVLATYYLHALPNLGYLPPQPKRQRYALCIGSILAQTGRPNFHITRPGVLS